MTHESERDFSDKVRVWLEDEFGEDNVIGPQYLDETSRLADFWVFNGLTIYAIEVENDFEAAVKGFGQSWLYSFHHPIATPIIILPEEHVQYPEVTMMRMLLPIIEFEETDSGVRPIDPDTYNTPSYNTQ